MLFINSDEFRQITGFLTMDGFLNHRPDISLEAFRHLFLPVLTISLGYWAILGRVTRSAVIEEKHKDHVAAARARGVSEHSLTWKHIFRNALTPSLTSSVMSAASLLTSLFIVELIFDFKGVASLVVDYNLPAPDAPMLLGFSIYSVFIVLFMMLILDLIIAALDPRVAKGLLPNEIDKSFSHALAKLDRLVHRAAFYCHSDYSAAAGAIARRPEGLGSLSCS